MSLRIEEYTLPAQSQLIGKNLRDSEIGQKTGAIILAIVDHNGNIRSNNQERTQLASIPLQEGDKLIAIGNEAQLQKLADFLQSQEQGFGIGKRRKKYQILSNIKKAT
ncbi:MAG: TrkA C-terminal domain-containing protein [Termitinemataceae bacterium]